MTIKRGTPVTFVGPDGDGPLSEGKKPFLSKKYGISIGDKGKVVRSNGGWTRVTWIRGDGSSAVSVPMRSNWIMCCAEEVQPSMNENFGFDEQPTPDSVVADMKKEIEKLLRTRSVHALLGIEISAARGRYGWRRRMLYDKVQQGVLSLEQMFQEEERAAIADERADAAKEAKLKAELEEVKLQLISARTLIQLKDKTIAQLRGEPTFESWGDWVVA